MRDVDREIPEETPETEIKTIGVEYASPRIGKRTTAVLIDGTCLILSCIILFMLLFMGTQNLGLYKDAQNTIYDVEMSTGLYVQPEDGSAPELLTDRYEDDSVITPGQLNEIYSDALDDFFASEIFFADGSGISFYNQQKAEHTDLFYKVDGLTEDDPGQYQPLAGANPEDLLDFYSTCIDNSVGFLTNVPAYTEASQTLMWAAIVTGILAYVICYTIFFLAVPFAFRRGFRTLGMAAARYGRVYVDGLNPTAGRFALHFLWSFLTLGIGFVALFIPVAISITMAMFGRFSQSLPDYLSNTYPVDMTHDSIYFTPREYAEALASVPEPRGEGGPAPGGRRPLDLPLDQHLQIALDGAMDHGSPSEGIGSIQIQTPPEAAAQMRLIGHDILLLQPAEHERRIDSGALCVALDIPSAKDTRLREEGPIAHLIGKEELAG